MRINILRRFLISTVAVTVFAAGFVRAWSQPLATTTTLVLTSGGSTVTSVPAGSLVTLTASVVSGTTPVTVGQVNFCDASAKYCTDIHMLATAQLIQSGPNAGKAVFRVVPGVGNRSYKAVFAGTPKATTPYAASTSITMTLTVDGNAPTTTTIAASGNPGNYSLTATVGGTTGVPPSGTVSFLDTSNANASLGTATLGAGSTDLTLNVSNIALTNFTPTSMASGDFNADGILDLVLESEGGPLTLFLGKGDGTFNAASNVPAPGTEPSFVVAGDFNGDGIPDLAVLVCSDPVCYDLDPGAVTILLGNGDGTFTAVAASPATGTDPIFMVTADFNGDGKADLAVVNTGFDSSYNPIPTPPTILLGNGDGTFTAGAAPGISGFIRYMVASDFNGDGIPDLAVATTNPAILTVFLGNGDGTFTAALNPVSGQFTKLVTADFNGDGKLDLIGDPQGGTLTLLLGNGDGTFTASTSQLGGSALDVAVGDFNGDGIPDLGVIDQFGDCTVRGDGQANILLGKGDGTFTQTASALNVECGTTTVVGDFNGGGIAGLAETGPVLSGTADLSVILPQWAATATATGISPVGTGTHQVAASYAGDSTNGPSVSSTIPLTAEQGKPTVTVTPSSSDITTVQPLTVTVAVSGGSGNPDPTGSVKLASGSYTSAATSLSSGSATITIPAGSLAAGTDTLAASYSGDANYTAATGTSSVPVATLTFAITGTAVSVSAGATSGNTSTVTVTPAAGFTGSVALTAALTTSPSGSTLPPTLSFGSTTPVAITGTAAGTATLTIATTASSSTPCSSANRTPPGIPWLAPGSAVLACVFLLGIPVRRRGRSILSLLLLLVALAGSMMACGGGGGTHCSPVTTAGTTAGTYTITVTGTSGALTETGTVTLTVH